MKTKSWVELAYKKLKGSVYFDKTQLPLVDQIVEFEADDVERQLHALSKMLDGPSDSWENYASEITKKANCLIYPKSLYSPKSKNIIFCVLSGFRIGRVGGCSSLAYFM